MAGSPESDSLAHFFCALYIAVTFFPMAPNSAFLSVMVLPSSAATAARFALTKSMYGFGAFIPFVAFITFVAFGAFIAAFFIAFMGAIADARSFLMGTLVGLL